MARRICLLVRDASNNVRVGAVNVIADGPEGDAFLAEQLAPEYTDERGFKRGGAWRTCKLPIEVDPAQVDRPVIDTIEDIHTPTAQDSRVHRAGWGVRCHRPSNTYTNDLPAPRAGREARRDALLRDLAVRTGADGSLLDD